MFPVRSNKASPRECHQAFSQRDHKILFYSRQHTFLLLKNHDIFSRRIPQSILPHIFIRYSLIDHHNLISHHDLIFFPINTTVTFSHWPRWLQKIVGFSITEETFSYRNTRPALTVDTRSSFVRLWGFSQRKTESFRVEETSSSQSRPWDHGHYLLE